MEKAEIGQTPPASPKPSATTSSGSSSAHTQLRGLTFDAGASLLRPDAGGSNPVQAKLAGGPSKSATPSAAGAGVPLAAPVQAKMERSFGTDFSAVRVHVGEQASGIGAAAYAQGNDVHFAPGRYQPGTTSGDELIGHELTHVVQQRQRRVSRDRQAKGGPINTDPGLEAEADRMGALAARGEPAQLGPAGSTHGPSDAPRQGKFEFTGKDDERDLSDVHALETWLSEMGHPIDGVKGETLEAFLQHPKTYTVSYDKAGAEQIAGWATTEFIGQAGYMTGDMYGICAALLLDPGLHMKIYVDGGAYYEAQYQRMAGVYNQTVSEFYAALHGKDYDQAELQGRMKETAKGIVAFYLSSGVDATRIKVIECADAQLEYAKNHKQPKFRPGTLPKQDREAPKDPQLKEAHHATEVVGAELGKDLEGARGKLKKAWLGAVTEEDRELIEGYHKEKFAGLGQIALLWGRVSGRTPGGAHPELNSNMVVMAQLTGLLKTQFPGVTVALAGDEVMPPDLVPLVGKTHLVKFWKDLPNGSNRHNQLYFLDLLREHNGAVALGMRSGAMEGPALLGMPTIYIDDADCSFLPDGSREGAGRRMELWSGEGSPERTKHPENTPAIEDELGGPLPTYKRLETEQLLGQLTQYIDEMDELLDDARSQTPGRWALIRGLIEDPKKLEKQQLDTTMGKLRRDHYRISASQLDAHTTAYDKAKTEAKPRVVKAHSEVIDRGLVARARYPWRDLGDPLVTDQTTAHYYLQQTNQRLKDVKPADGGDAALVFDRFWPALDAIELGKGELEQVAQLLTVFGLKRD